MSWILTEQDEINAIEQAVYDKTKLRNWNARNAGYPVDEARLAILTDEERATVLDKANKIKTTKVYFDTLVAEKHEREARELTTLISEWNYARFYKLMKDNSRDIYGKPLEFNETTSKLIQCICWRFGKDPRYETELGFSFSKGLIIRGGYGLGKSYLIDLIKDNPVNNIQIINMKVVRDEVMKNGEYNGINYGKYRTIYIDDVGKEYDKGERIKHFGTDINWFKDYIETFYTKWPQAFNRIIVSTNDNFQVIQDKYGEHIRDRMKQMFDVIDVTGKSMR